MTKIVRATQKIFGGSLVAANNIAVFGSLQNGSPAYSLDPTTIQSLAAFTNGWTGAVVNNKSPALQDFNALDYLYSRQLAYILQQGIAEYDASTEYHQNSLCTSSNIIYISLINTNVGQSISDTSKWKPWLTSIREGASEAPRGYSAKSASFSIAITDSTLYFVTVSSASITATLPTGTTVKQGYRVRFVIAGATPTNVFAVSPAVAGAQITAGGFVELVAIQDNPSIAAHWQIIDSGEGLSTSNINGNELSIVSGGTAATSKITLSSTTWQFGGTNSTISEAGAANFATSIDTPVLFVTNGGAVSSGRLTRNSSVWQFGGTNSTISESGIGSFATSVNTPLMIASGAFELRTGTSVSSFSITALGACSFGSATASNLNHNFNGNIRLSGSTTTAFPSPGTYGIGDNTTFVPCILSPYYTNAAGSPPAGGWDARATILMNNQSGSGWFGIGTKLVNLVIGLTGTTDGVNNERTGRIVSEFATCTYQGNWSFGLNSGNILRINGVTSAPGSIGTPTLSKVPGSSGIANDWLKLNINGTEKWLPIFNAVP